MRWSWTDRNGMNSVLRLVPACCYRRVYRGRGRNQTGAEAVFGSGRDQIVGGWALFGELGPVDSGSAFASAVRYWLSAKVFQFPTIHSRGGVVPCHPRSLAARSWAPPSHPASSPSFPGMCWEAAGYVAPSDKITLAHIGMGTQGFRELGGLLADPQIQIVAVCDPNTDSNDYVEWGKNGIRNQIRRYLGNPTWRENDSGCPGGREVGREVVDTYYAKQRGAEKFKACSAYADFRELLEKEKDLDAVKVMTPDHLHATDLDRGDEEGQARHDAQADRQPAVRGPAGHRDGPPDEGGHAPAGLRQRDRQRADRRADQAGRHRPAAGSPQLDEPAGVAAVHGDPHGHAAGPEGTRLGLVAGARRSTAPIIRTTRTPCSAAGTISAAVRWPTWASTACGPCSPRWTWACRSAPRPGRPTPARSWTASAGP